MKRAAKIAFPDIVFVDSITYIVGKFQRYTSEKSQKDTASKIHKLYIYTIIFLLFCQYINFIWTIVLR